MMAHMIHKWFLKSRDVKIKFHCILLKILNNNYILNEHVIVNLLSISKMQLEQIKIESESVTNYLLTFIVINQHKTNKIF